MATVFKWVHLSDVHFEVNGGGFNTTDLRNQLPNYLKENVGNCNALIITGDYRFAPKRETNPKPVAEYITQLAQALHVENQIYIVPGNHDLERSTPRKYLMEGAQNDYSPKNGTIDPGTCAQLLKSFSFFDELCKLLSLKLPTDANNPHWIAQTDKCNLLLLNTAITAGCDEDTNRLILGSEYIRALIEKSEIKSKPIIAVGHHSLEELNKAEKDTIAKLLEKNNIMLYLCGHAHEHRYHSYGERGEEVTVGCLKQDDSSVMATFEVGELFDDGTVKITSHIWDFKEQGWYLDYPRKREFKRLYPEQKSCAAKKASTNIVQSLDYPLKLKGLCLLDNLGADGIKYYWDKDGAIFESIALNRRLKDPTCEEDNKTSAYTISTSIGCQLAAMKKQCRFCETGMRNFVTPLTGEEIALQCIFMAEYDTDCGSYPRVRGNAREFAFMGQGEPGLNYPAIRRAIILTDYVMEQLNQTVSRYIISTCGILDLIPALIQDIKNGVFKNSVTIHFSLHSIGDERLKLMPISQNNDYTEIIKQCKVLRQHINDKIGVGVLMFDQYQPIQSEQSYTLTKDKLQLILKELDKDVFRIDLCAVNNTTAGKQMHQQSAASANDLLCIVKDAGFDGKIFTSFGGTQRAGCGMLSSAADDMQAPGNTTITHYNTAVNLLKEAKEYYMRMLNKM